MDKLCWLGQGLCVHSIIINVRFQQRVYQGKFQESLDLSWSDNQLTRVIGVRVHDQQKGNHQGLDA